VLVCNSKLRGITQEFQRLDDLQGQEFLGDRKI